MAADDYLIGILNREAVNIGSSSPVRNVQAIIQPAIAEWAGNLLMNISPSGSFAKGTANHSGTDIDLFISLSDRTNGTLKEIYESLFKKLGEKKFDPKRQNVSINVRVNGYSVDLVPAKRQDNQSDDHSLYRRRGDTWTKTNVIKHINYVKQGGRINETRILKLWRNQKGLDFPSFYLELTVINALSGRYLDSLSSNVLTVFEYLRDTFSNSRVVDPANTNNVISDDLNATERAKVKAAAEQARSASDWNQIVR